MKNIYSVRTDLAVEARELLEEKNGDIDDGIVVRNEETQELKVTHVEITSKKGSQAMGKPMGKYITIEAQGLRENNPECHEEVSHKLKECILELSEATKDTVFLIVGLGNWNITPDALGPQVVGKILVTRHMINDLPEEISTAVRPVAAISPGVMGITGIETGEIIKGVVDKLKPDVVIAIDALAARKFSRVNSTIQLSDTGICPGAGVGNKRKELSQETLGVKVIALGVPTVVDAATLANDTIDRVIEEMLKMSTKGSEFYNMLVEMEEEERYSLIQEILNPYEGNMFVTPKEVDIVIERLSKVIAGAVNAAVHPGISVEDLGRYTN